MTIYLANLTPLSGAENIRVDSSIQLSILDTLYSILSTPLKIWVDDTLAYDAAYGGFQTDFSGTITPSGSGFDIEIIPTSSLEYETAIEIATESYNDNGESSRLVYLFSTTLNLYYNIYVATSANSSWRIANSSPLLHNLDGNEYTISGLQGNVPYHISLVAGRMESGEFVPLIDQPIGVESRGALDIFSVNNYPKYIIKTFSP